MNIFNFLPSSAIQRAYRHIVRNADAAFDFATARNSTVAALMRLKKVGFQPQTIFDIGAYEGQWTVAAAKVFPQSGFQLFEALPEKQSLLEQQTSHLRREIHIALLGPENKEEVQYFSMESGSGVLVELSEVERSAIRLPMHRLDSWQHQVSDGPILMKLDVQGYELQVLAGAGDLLKYTDIILMECSVVPYNLHAPLMADTLSAMDRLGYLLFDIAEMHRKASGQQLLQVDLVFAKKDSRWIREASDLKGKFSVFTV